MTVARATRLYLSDCFDSSTLTDKPQTFANVVVLNVPRHEQGGHPIGTSSRRGDAGSPPETLIGGPLLSSDLLAHTEMEPEARAHNPNALRRQTCAFRSCLSWDLGFGG